MICGSCRERTATMTLPVSGLRRCQPCVEALDIPHVLPDRTEAESVTTRPASTTQPRVYRKEPLTATATIARDYKQAAGKDDSA